MSTITTLTKRYGNKKVAIDFLKARDLILADMIGQGGWANLSDEDKYAVIKMFVFTDADPNTDTTNKATFLTIKGHSGAEISEILGTAYPHYQQEARIACQKRRGSQAFMSVLQTYLEIPDMVQLLETTKNLLAKYSEEAIIGSAYGLAGDGIADFLENTSGFEFTGLEAQAFSTKTGTKTDLANDLMDILKDGNYTK